MTTNKKIPIKKRTGKKSWAAMYVFAKFSARNTGEGTDRFYLSLSLQLLPELHVNAIRLFLRFAEQCDPCRFYRATGAFDCGVNHTTGALRCLLHLFLCLTAGTVCAGVFKLNLSSKRKERKEKKNETHVKRKTTEKEEWKGRTKQLQKESQDRWRKER